ncbi:MAG: molybdenum cofactor biosynthesis protein B [Pseudomonadales bacterium]|jgi:molybdenum cofactor biosynthesis protein B|nr:molybdenum cofactor biosynthesis protein B [Pseudomonadales bacterium]
MTPTPKPLSIAVLTVSDTRTPAEDRSGDLLCERLETAGHALAERALEPDDRYQLRARVSVWIADPGIDVILTTGGTGFTGRDTTPEALSPLFDKTIEGFGELFRQLSYTEIGTSTIQSRALAGLAGGTLIFCMPGSTGACATAWDGILATQLDVRHRPCNFVDLIPRFREA